MNYMTFLIHFRKKPCLNLFLGIGLRSWGSSDGQVYGEYGEHLVDQMVSWTAAALILMCWIRGVLLQFDMWGVTKKRKGRGFWEIKQMKLESVDPRLDGCGNWSNWWHHPIFWFECTEYAEQIDRLFRSVLWIPKFDTWKYWHMENCIWKTSWLVGSCGIQDINWDFKKLLLLCQYQSPWDIGMLGQYQSKRAKQILNTQQDLDTNIN